MYAIFKKVLQIFLMSICVILLDFYDCMLDVYLKLDAIVYKGERISNNKTGNGAENCHT